MTRAPVRPALGLAAAALAGAASVAGFAPLSLFPLPLLTLALLFALAARSRGAGGAAALGFAFGLGLFGAGVSWIYISLHQYGGMPAPLAVLAVLLFCAYLSLYPALALALFARLRSGNVLRDALLAAAAWMTTEWVRGWFLSGFPWLAFGNSQTPPSPLAGFAPLVGSYGVGFVLVALAAALGLSAGMRARLLAAVGAVALVCAAGLALMRIEWTQPSGAPLAVKLLQPNIPQSLKWQPELIDRWLQDNLDMVASNPAPLVVLPETTLPLTADDLPPGYAERLAAAARAAEGNVLFGVFTRDIVDGRARYFNTALSLGVDAPQRYRKSHLVAFGEYSPPGLSWVYRWLSIPMSDQSPGPWGQAPLALGGQQVAVNICYEDAFGEEIIAALPRATLLLNLTNTAWFGRSLAQPQHLQMSQMRALETGRPMLRATNTGMTAVIATDGTVSAHLPAFERGVLAANVRGYTGLTPYARVGNFAALGLAFAVIGFCFLARRLS